MSASEREKEKKPPEHSHQKKKKKKKKKKNPANTQTRKHANTQRETDLELDAKPEGDGPVPVAVGPEVNHRHGQRAADEAVVHQRRHRQQQPPDDGEKPDVAGGVAGKRVGLQLARVLVKVKLQHTQRDAGHKVKRTKNSRVRPSFKGHPLRFFLSAATPEKCAKRIHIGHTLVGIPG